MVLCYLLITLKGKYLKLISNKTILITGSCLYGFLSGLLGSGNIIKAVLFREMPLNKESFVGIMAAISVLTNMAKLTAYAKDGLISVEHTGVILALVISAVVSALIGRYLLKRISIRYFQQGVAIVLFCVAITLLI